MQPLRFRAPGARFGSSACAALLLLACSSTPPPEDATTAPTEEAPADAAEPELSPEAAALIAETSEDPATPASNQTPPPASGEVTPGKGLDLVYRLKSDGLHIEVLGAEFLPKARAVKIAGGWGVEIEVEAQATEDVSLLGSKQGPLAFAARVTRPGEETIGDSRNGSEDIWLRPEKAARFKRTWPDAGTPPLKAGQTLELQVGLWGLGDTPEARKPVRKFFVVKMSPDQKGATALVSPPQ